MYLDSPLSWKVRLTFCIGPFIMNACFIIFIAVSITTTLHPLEPRNSIPLTSCFLIYLIGIGIMTFYGLIMGNWSEIFYGVDDTGLSIALIITWPIFYLLFLPFAVYRLVSRVGSPKGLWEKLFSGTGGSLENLRCEGESGGKLFLRYIYIGIPFGLFALIYIVIMVFFSPLWYFILSPIGMGMYSVCLGISCHSEEVRVTSINDRVDRTFRWGMFFNVFVVAVMEFLCTVCYAGLVGAQWQAIVALLASLLYFLPCSIPTIYWMCCGRNRPTDDLLNS